MTAWSDRPQIVAAYLNPALLSVVVLSAARGYAQRGELMPWPMSFLVAPLVLHRPTREALPGNTRTHLSTWVQRNPLLRAGLPARAESLASSVSEGLRFGLRHGEFTMQDGRLRSRVNIRVSNNEHLEVLIKSATLAGRWLSLSQVPSTPFALLGVVI